MTKQLNSPLILREEVQTEFGAANIVLSKYSAADLLSVHLCSARDDVEKDVFAGEPIATLSFNPVDPIGIATADFAEFFCKTWSENAPLVQPLLNSGMFECVIYKSPALAEWTSGEIWRLKGSALEQFNQALAQQDSQSDAEDGGRDDEGPKP